jgi:hypothetical protein
VFLCRTMATLPSRTESESLTTRVVAPDGGAAIRGATLPFGGVLYEETFPLAFSPSAPTVLLGLRIGIIRLNQFQFQLDANRSEHTELDSGLDSDSNADSDSDAYPATCDAESTGICAYGQCDAEAAQSHRLHAAGKPLIR